MRKKVEGYRTATTTIELRLYEDELRKLFKLPLRKGKFTGATFNNNQLEINFVTANHKYIYI